MTAAQKANKPRADAHVRLTPDLVFLRLLLGAA